MKDETVVGLCETYLLTKDKGVLNQLCDRLEELGDPRADEWRRWFGLTPPSWDHFITVPEIMQQYGSDQ